MRVRFFLFFIPFDCSNVVVVSHILYGHHIHIARVRINPGCHKVANNPARGQLEQGKLFSPVPVRARDFGLVRQVRQSRPASTCSSPHPGWIWCLLTTGFLPSSAAASIYICMLVTHIARVWINRVWLPILLVVSWTGKMNISLSAFAPENLVSREGLGIPSRVSLLISILRLNLVLTYYGIPPEIRDGVHTFILNRHTSYAMESVPSLSGHAIAYRWRSLPRVRRHRASKPKGSSERVLPWQVTMDQLICASLSHTH